MPSTWGKRRGLQGYDRMRTGLTFDQVLKSFVWSYSDDKATWPKGITRAVVLGRWHELKLAMWEEMQAAEAMHSRRAAGNERW